MKYIFLIITILFSYDLFANDILSNCNIGVNAANKPKCKSCIDRGQQYNKRTKECVGVAQQQNTESSPAAVDNQQQQIIDNNIVKQDDVSQPEVTGNTVGINNTEALIVDQQYCSTLSSESLKSICNTCFAENHFFSFTNSKCYVPEQ